MARIRFVPVCSVSEDTQDRNRAYSRGLGLPEIVPGKAGAAASSLAVVGGSPDVSDHIETLRHWNGEVWAINQTFEWCRENGIPATFYRIDPMPAPPGYLDGIEKAILGDIVHPGVFAELIANGADIELVRLGHDHILPATTAAGTAPMFACWRGHRHITLFGCGSSYTDRTHAYRSDKTNLLWLDCGGRDYVTSPQMLMQAEWLAEMAREFPKYITVQGDGLLPALIEHGDYDVTHVCGALDKVLKGQSHEPQ